MKSGKRSKKVNKAQIVAAMRNFLSTVFLWLLSVFALFSRFGAILKHRIRRIPARFRMIRKEWIGNNFPESNRVLIQLPLFVFGMFPMCASLLHEKLHSFRRAHNRAKGKRETQLRLHLRKLKPIHFVCTAVAVAAVAIFFSFFTFGTTVVYNGIELETVGSTRIAKRAAANISDITVETLGESSYAISEDLLHYDTGLVRRSEVAKKTDLERELADEIGLVSYGYSLYVNDELIGSTPYEGALDDLLEQLKQLYTSADTLSVDFVEDVRIAKGYVAAESVMNLGQIAELLNSTKAGEITYTVQEGDTWSGIADENGISLSELSDLNPGYDIDHIHVGDALTISNAVPYLTIVVTERQNYHDAVSYDISYEDDPSLYQGDYRVISKGVYGEADIVADVTYVNGVEADRTVISTVMLTAPVTEYRAKGTKERPSWAASGSFRWPTSGRITSNFGYRNTGIRGASTNHKGIDISVSYGTPIYAADGGTVTFSGYKGAMGYVVIIDHGNGYVTYYEHNSSLLVSAGAHVYKGQQIAKAGRSGVASGVHCHFGIERNGTYVNPLNYLP